MDKLFLVKTKNLEAYVVSSDFESAKKAFEDWLRKEDYGFLSEREVLEVTLIAETSSKPNSMVYSTEMLILDNKKYE